MKKTLLILIGVLFFKAGFAQQISVQGSELKYRTSSGVIATAANKDSLNNKTNAIKANVTALQVDRNALFDSVEVHRTAINTKQSNLVSGTNIKTIESLSLLGSGNIDLTKGQVGLSFVDNTSDILKPISLATQAGLDSKANLLNPVFTGTVSGITSNMVGLGNVNNTSDANKPISTATQTALNLKANIASPTFTGTVSGITKSMVGLGNVDNTTDLNKPISTLTQTALNGKFATPTGLTTNNLTKWNGTTFVNSLVSDNGTNVSVANDATINGLTVGRGGGNFLSNTALGGNAGTGNSTGVGNVFFGYFSGLGNTTGNDNTYIGVGAGRFSETGSGNTFIGNYAGRFIADGITSNVLTNNSTYVGYGARSLSDNQTNQMVFGYNAIGLGSNTTVLGNSATTFGRWWGNLLVGSLTNSGEALQITGTAKVTSKLTAGNYRLSALNTAPASATATGTVGEIRWNANYMYVCVGTNTWKRSALTTW